MELKTDIEKLKMIAAESEHLVQNLKELCFRMRN